MMERVFGGLILMIFGCIVVLLLVNHVHPAMVEGAITSNAPLTRAIYKALAFVFTPLGLALTAVVVCIGFFYVQSQQS